MATIFVTGPAAQSNFPAQQSNQIGYFATARKNRRLETAMSSGFLLLIGSYVHLSWSFWSLLTLGLLAPPAYDHQMAIITATIISWIIGAFNGCIIAGYVLNNLPNKMANYLGAATLFVSGILFVAGYNSLVAMNVGRLLAGCCNGMIYIGVVKQIGDNASPSYRGTMAAKLSILSVFGLFISSLVMIRGAVGSEGLHDQMIGFATLAFALASAIYTRFTNYDSVVRLIDEGREREAIDMLIKLRKERHESCEIRNEFDEMKAMVSEANTESQSRPKHIFSGGNGSVLKAVIELKILNLFATNYVLYAASLLLFANWFHVNLTLVFFPVARLGAALFAVILCEKYGRRKLFLISVIGTGSSLTLLGILGIIYVVGIEQNNAIHLAAAIVACFVQIFTFIGLDPIQHVYAVEAFPLAKRTSSLIFVTCLEHLLHILMIVSFVLMPVIQATYTILIIVYAIAIFVDGLRMYKCLPETRGMTLRQCQNEFNKKRSPVAHNAKLGTGVSSIGITYANA